MVAKVLVALLVALCASQAAAGSLTSNEKDLLKIWSPADILELIGKILGIVETLIPKVETAIIDFFRDALDLFDDVLNWLAAEWKEDIEKLVYKIEKTEEEIKDCWENYNESLKSLWKKLLYDSKDCLEDQIKLEKLAAELLRGTAFDILKEVKATATMVSECLKEGSLANATLCFIEDTPTYIARFIELDLQLDGDIYLVLDQATNTVPKAAFCVASRTVIVLAEAQEDLQSCIAKAL